jgi:signal transduction histidine kinase/DNA-binding response OmpR family regulator
MTEFQPDDSQGDILIVDDDLAGLRALSTLLADQGYEVRRATDGQTALMIAAADPPDLILLDVIMPGIDGFEVCQRLKSSAATAEIPVLFVSALGEVVDKVRGLEAGGVDYITKPFNAEEVRARVGVHLRLQRLQKALEQRNVELQQEIRERMQAQEALRASQQLIQSSLDALSAHIAILDGQGTILAVNSSWRHFADQNGFTWDDYGVGRNYLEVTESASGELSQAAHEAANGIRQVMTGHRQDFRLEYPCHSPEEERWFVLRVTRFESSDGLRVVTSHEDITERKHAEDALRERVKELNCLYGISAIIEKPGISLEEILQGTVDLLPAAWQYPEITCVRILTAHNEFQSEGFRVTAWKQESHLSVYGERCGSVEVYYLEEKPQGDEGPFLKEERNLLDAIAERLSRVVERFAAEGARRRRVREMSALHRVAQTVAAVSDLTEALEIVAETVAGLFDARSTLFAVPDYEAAELQVLAGFERTSGPHSTTSMAFSLNETPFSRQVLDGGQSIVLPDFQAVSLAPSVQTFVRERGLQTMLFVPLRARGTVVGLLAVGSDRPGRDFSPDEIALAETIAGDVAAALENARLAEQAQAAAVDAERQRLARELHDSVTQSLYSLTLLSKGWETMAAQGRLANPAGSFQRLNQVGQQALKEMRLLIHQLRPPVLEEVGLEAALRQRLEAVEQRANVEARLVTKGDTEGLPDEVEEQLLHLAQEALNNALRHSAATEVMVRIEIEANQVLLSVEDNGAGFDPSADSAGMGLSTMKERAEAIGGQMTITTAPEQGTTVEVAVALGAAEGV